MPYKFNPTTGNLDYYEAGVTPSKTYTISNDLADRVLDASAETLDEVTNVLVTLLRDLAEKNIITVAAPSVPAAVRILRGQPIGLAGVTYANDVN